MKNEDLVDRKKVVSAIKAIKQLQKDHMEKVAATKPLLGESEGMSLQLQIVLKKIPFLKNIKMIKVSLPHSLVSETSEVCLFTGDLDKRDKKAEIEPTVLHYKELLQKHEIKFVNEVIPLRQLRTDYKPHEAKRQLMAGYDFFLAEDSIVGCLPTVLGKSFFKKRKFPQQISFKKGDLKKNMENALSNTVLYLTGRGESCCMDVANLNWKVKKIADNVMAAINALPQKLPGSTPNIDLLYLKAERSKALPLYVSFESGNNIHLPKSEKPLKIDPEEITTVSKAKVKVCPSGSVKIVPDLKEEASSGSDSEEGPSPLLLKMMQKKNLKRKGKHSVGKKKSKKQKIEKA